MYKKIALILMFGCLLTFAGCGPKLPDGLPKRVPVTLTITQDGKPLAGAVVSLIPEDQDQHRWSASGNTDEQGVVSPKILSKYPGAMIGKHKVVISCVRVDESTRKERRDSEGKLEGTTVDSYETVSSDFNLITTTKQTIEIQKGENVHTIDCGKPVRIKPSNKNMS